MLKIIENSIKYFVKRTFRIYIPFVLFCIIQDIVFLKLKLLKKSPKKKISDFDFFHLTSLNMNVESHLWTIPVEIRYYFVIPIIALIFSKLRSIKTFNYRLLIISMPSTILLFYSLSTKFQFTMYQKKIFKKND